MIQIRRCMCTDKSVSIQIPAGWFFKTTEPETVREECSILKPNLHTILAQIKPGFPVCLQFMPIRTNSAKPEIGRADRLVLALSLQQVDLQGESSSHLLTNAIMWTLGSSNKLTGQGTCVCVCGPVPGWNWRTQLFFNNSVVWLGRAKLRADIHLPSLLS